MEYGPLGSSILQTWGWMFSPRQTTPWQQVGNVCQASRKAKRRRPGDGRWFWLVDVLDAFSRYLVHCEVLLTARANVVQLAVQQAVETLDGRERLLGELEIVHDAGPQFPSREWRFFVDSVGMTDVRTKPYHPQSNGLDERVHRTIREEVPLDPDATLFQVQGLIEEFRVYHNERRPHSALRCLRPVDYYRGDPEARLAEREAKLKRAAEARRL